MNKVIVKKIEKLLKYQFKAIFLRRYKGTYMYMYTGAFIHVLDQLRWKQIKCEGRGANPQLIFCPNIQFLYYIFLCKTVGWLGMARKQSNS